MPGWIELTEELGIFVLIEGGWHICEKLDRKSDPSNPTLIRDKEISREAVRNAAEIVCNATKNVTIFF
jgi:hypothetical protein